MHRHVERGGRLVCQQHAGSAGQRQGNHRPLAHAAGHLVRIGLQPPGGRRDLHHFQQLERAPIGSGVGHAFVPHDRLSDLHADGEHGVEGDHRLLEDHGDLGAAHLAQGRLVHRSDLMPGHADPPLYAGARRRQQAHQRAQGHALA